MKEEREEKAQNTGRRFEGKRKEGKGVRRQEGKEQSVKQGEGGGEGRRREGERGGERKQ